MKNLCRQGKVFSYLRWSSDGQTLGDSERRQTEPALDWCKQHGRVLDDRDYTDRGVSGWRGAHRKHGRLGELLSIVKAGDTILVEDASRWSREPALDSMNALRDTVNKGVDIVFLKSGIVVNRDNFNRPDVFLSNVLNSFMANAENEERARKIREAMEAKRQQLAQGRLIFGRLPAWLAWDLPPKRPDRKVVVVKEKAALVRRIFEFCVAGKGVRFIERQLRDCPPIANSRKANWNSRFIHRLLRDKSVLGYYAPTDTPNIYPAIVDEGTFYAAGTALDRRRHQTVRQSCADHNLFTGLLRCAACSNTLVRHTTHAHGHDYTYLLCTGRLRGLAPGCSAAGLRYDWFERAFLSLMAHGLLMRMILNDRQEGPSALDILKGKLADAQAQAEKYMRLIDGDDNPARRLSDALKAAEAKEAALQAQLEAETAKAKTAVPAVQAYDACCDLFGRGLKPEDRGRLRLALRDFVDRIVVDLEGKHYDVYFHGCKLPITVHPLSARDWTFDPAPIWTAYNEKVAALAAS